MQNHKQENAEFIILNKNFHFSKMQKREKTRDFKRKREMLKSKSKKTKKVFKKVLTSAKVYDIISCVTERRKLCFPKTLFMEEVNYVYFYGKKRDSGT